MGKTTYTTISDHGIFTLSKCESEDLPYIASVVLKPRPVVAVLITDEDLTHAIIQRQFRPGTGMLEWELPAGHVNEGEKTRSAAAREVEEETGLSSLELDLLGSYNSSPGMTNEYVYIYHAIIDRFESNAVADGDEIVENYWFPIKEAMIHSSDAKFWTAMGFLYKEKMA